MENAEASCSLLSMNAGECMKSNRVNSMESTEQLLVNASDANKQVIDEPGNFVDCNVVGSLNFTETSANNSRSWDHNVVLAGELGESAVSSSEQEDTPHQSQQTCDSTEGCSSKEVMGGESNVTNVSKKSQVRKKYVRVKLGDDLSNLEDSSQQVRKRFELGCECAESCFRGLNPEAVYRHRLNIAELTKEEHDMYLMGVTMACMSDPVSTNKRRERRRARPNYAYSGRKVCLSAFLYLENVTLYQLKRIRKHVMMHGVTPRIHGNHGKKPHNVFPLDIYRRATVFLKDFIQQHSASGNPKSPVILPPDITRKFVHNTYKDYVGTLYSPNEKILGYSTFRHFMKEQFPNLRFSKSDSGFINNNSSKGSNAKQHCKSAKADDSQEAVNDLKQEMSTSGFDVSQIPVLLAEGSLKDCDNETLVVTPLSHFLRAKDLSQETFTFATIS